MKTQKTTLILSCIFGAGHRRLVSAQTGSIATKGVFLQLRERVASNYMSHLADELGALHGFPVKHFPEIKSFQQHRDFSKSIAQFVTDKKIHETKEVARGNTDFRADHRYSRGAFLARNVFSSKKKQFLS